MESNNINQNNGDKKQDDIQDQSVDIKKALYEIEAKNMLGSKPLRINKFTVWMIIGFLCMGFFGLIIHYSEVKPVDIPAYDKGERTDLGNIGISIILPEGFEAPEGAITGHYTRKDGVKIVVRSRPLASIHIKEAMNPNRFTCVFYAESILREFSEGKEKYEIDISSPALIGKKTGAIVVLVGKGSECRFSKITACSIVQNKVVYEVLVFSGDNKKTHMEDEELNRLFGSLRPVKIVRKIPELRPSK